jgi:LAO/AO transport system kinase
MPHAINTSTQKLAEQIHQGDTRALARAISLIENNASQAQDILSACFPYTGKALRIGITGSPGAGKSTLVDQLARAWRKQEQTIGIVAVDPTSPFTGGAILGDRIRLQDHSSDPGLYVRSMATRGALGGLAQATADAAQLIEASGKDLVLIETVGVGQDEIDIVRLSDITLVILVPGMGDDVQSLKAGIMEIADIFVINKADREGADRVEKEIRAMQSLSHSVDNWTPPVIKTIATTGAGIAELISTIDARKTWLATEGRMEAKRQTYWQQRIETMVQQALLKAARTHGLSTEELAQHAQRITAKEENPYQLVPNLVAEIFQHRKAKP